MNIIGKMPPFDVLSQDVGEACPPEGDLPWLRCAMHKFLDFVQEMAAGGQSVHKNLKSVQEMMV